MRLHADQLCECARPHRSGRCYLRSEACGSCGLFIARSLQERERIKREHQRALKRQRDAGRLRIVGGLEP